MVGFGKCGKIDRCHEVFATAVEKRCVACTRSCSPPTQRGSAQHLPDQLDALCAQPLQPPTTGDPPNRLALSCVQTIDFAKLHTTEGAEGLGLKANRDTYTAMMVAAAKLSNASLAMEIYQQ